MIYAQFDTIDEAVLQQLVANGVEERRDLEFKRDLPGGNDEQTKEFLADVTSLANAQGGDLIFGIEDENGAAAALPGLTVADVDAEVLRLENKVRDGVAPRLMGVRTKWVPLANGNGALVIRVPAGLAAPHRIIYKNSGRFFSRTSRGKFEMDVDELRHAFTESSQLPARFRALHARAVTTAQGLDMPFAITAEPMAIVSVIPLALFREERDIPVTADHALAPVKPSGIDWIEMIEGVLMHTPVNDVGTVRSMALTYRTGRTDVAWTIGGTREIQGVARKLVFSPSFEGGLLDAAISSQSKLGLFGVEGPWVVFASVIGVKDSIMFYNDHYASRAAYRDQVLLGELRLDHIDEAALMPIARNFWLMMGEKRPEDRPLGK